MLFLGADGTSAWPLPYAVWGYRRRMNQFELWRINRNKNQKYGKFWFWRSEFVSQSKGTWFGLKARAMAMDWKGEHSEIDKAMVGICERHPIESKLPKWIEQPVLVFTLSSFFCFSNRKWLEDAHARYLKTEILHLTPLVLDQLSCVTLYNI